MDATIKVFAPDINLSTQRPKEHRPRLSPFKNGEVPTLIMDVLRESTIPLSTREIAEAITAKRGVDIEGYSYVKIVNRIGTVK